MQFSLTLSIKITLGLLTELACVVGGFISRARKWQSGEENGAETTASPIVRARFVRVFAAFLSLLLNKPKATQVIIE